MNNQNNVFSVDFSKIFSDKSTVIKGNKFRITILSDVLIRLEYSETGVFNDYPSLNVINRNFSKPEFNVTNEKDKIIIENYYFKLEYYKERNFLGTKVTPEANLRVLIKETKKLWYLNNPEVRNHLGSTYSLDGELHKVKLNKGLYSTDGFALLNDSNSLIYLQNGSVVKRASSGYDLYLFAYGKDFKRALNSYFNLTGFPILIPRYALGIWWNKSDIYNIAKVQEVNYNFKKNKIPYSVLLLDSNWHLNNYNNKLYKSGFTFNRSLITNEVDFTSYMHLNKVKVGLEIDPFGGIMPYEEKYENFKKLINNPNSVIIPFNVYNIDFVNNFISYLIDPLINKKVDFFLIDSSLQDHVREFILNNYLYKNYKKYIENRGLIVSRYNGFSSHTNSIQYSGETKIDWKTLEFLPFFNSTSANIGLSWWSHAIGGFKDGIEDSELYMRYIQFGTFSPIFRLASAKGKYYKREPWKWDIRTFSVVKEYMRLRHKLIPYLYSCAYSYHKHGDLLIEPLYYDYPDIFDEPLYKNEYYFGNDLLISPITQKKDDIMNRVVHKIYIPKGTWYDFKTGKKYAGDKRYITFYKDEDYPVFAKSGAIIPLAVLDDENLNDTSSPKNMEIHVFPGTNNSFNLYEDDGISSLYEDKNYILTNIDYNYRENNYTLIIRPIEGKSGVIEQLRNYKIIFRNTKFAEDVSVYINNVEYGYKKYIEGENFVIEVNDVNTSCQLTINCKGNDIEIDTSRIINEELDDIINDLKITTELKITLAGIILNDNDIKKKRIEVKKLKHKGLDEVFIKMFLKLFDYLEAIKK